jgi:hypothetical protein
MKRLMFGGLAALALALSATPAWAGCSFDYSVCRHICFTYTGRNRCLHYTSCSNPVPCPSGYCSVAGGGMGGYGGPVAWDGLAAYGAPAYGVAPYAAPVAAAPVAAPATPAQPSFQAPQPNPANKSSTGLQQAVYYYGQPGSTGYAPSAGYGYGAGYMYYGAGYGYGYTQVPNYWY